MSLIKKIVSLEERVEKFENSIPDWIALSNFFAEQYGYSLDGFRKWCLTNIRPEHFKKFGKSYHIHKTALHLLKKR